MKRKLRLLHKYGMQKYKLNENQYKIYKEMMLNENQESDSQKKAIDYLVNFQAFEEAEANTFVRKKLRMIVNVLNANKRAGKFTLGCTRILFVNDLVNDDGEVGDYDNALKRVNTLNKIVKYICDNEELYNKFDKNLNGWSFYKLSHEFKDYHFNIKNSSEKKSGQSKYKIYKIQDFNHAWTFNEFVSWCVTHSESAYNDYTLYGEYQFYFCLRQDFQYEKAVAGDNAPLDSYGLSMLAICVDSNGELETCTCRWNHDNGGTDHCMNVEQIEEVLNLNFYDTFKPKVESKDESKYTNLKEKLEKVKTVRDLLEFKDTNKNNGIFYFKDAGYLGYFNCDVRDFGYLFSDVEFDGDANSGYSYYISNEEHLNHKVKKIATYDNDNPISEYKDKVLYCNLDGEVCIIDREGRPTSEELTKAINENIKKRGRRDFSTRIYNSDIFLELRDRSENKKYIIVDNKIYDIDGNLKLEIEDKVLGVKCGIVTTGNGITKPNILQVRLIANKTIVNNIFYDIHTWEKICEIAHPGKAINLWDVNKNFACIGNNNTETYIYCKGRVYEYKNCEVVGNPHNNRHFKCVVWDDDETNGDVYISSFKPDDEPVIIEGVNVNDNKQMFIAARNGKSLIHVALPNDETKIVEV